MSRHIRKMKAQKVYLIAYKHDEHGSDHLGCEFVSPEAARREIEVIRQDPGAAGYVEWLKEACLWVTDDQGSIY